MSEPESWDLEKVYDDQIAPLMTQVIAICKEHRMPMVASFAYAHQESDDGETSFCTTNLPFPARPVPNLEAAYREILRRRTVLAMTITSGSAPRDPGEGR